MSHNLRDCIRLVVKKTGRDRYFNLQVKTRSEYKQIPGESGYELVDVWEDIPIFEEKEGVLTLKK